MKNVRGKDIRIPAERKALPAKCEPGFLNKLDQRFELARELKAAYTELTDDLGGTDNLSHVKRTLAERFVWLTAILRSVELQIAEAKGEDDGAQLLSRWIQAINSLSGLAKVLGVDRRTRKVDLKTYVEGQNR